MRFFRFLEFWKPRSDRANQSFTGKDHQVFIIGGGEIFNTYADYLSWLQDFELRETKHPSSWKSWLAQELLSTNVPVVRVGMPNTFNAKYREWEIMFEKYLDRFPAETLTLVGHSLGAMFLVKFLAAKPTVEAKCRSIHLVAPQFKPAFTFALPLSKLPNNSKYFWYHSTDDEIVPYADSTLVQLERSHLSNNRLFTYSNRGHFLESEFFELREHVFANLPE